MAARAAGDTGRVIGVDMTHEMLEKARENVRRAGIKNLEFRLGEIEYLPIADASADIVISNCVINLSPGKRQVFKEANRVLELGGRLMVSGIVLEGELPPAGRHSVAACIGCISGADAKKDYLRKIEDAGFRGVEILERSYFAIDCMLNDPTARAIMETSKMTKKDIDELNHTVLSIRVRGDKVKCRVIITAFAAQSRRGNT